jgi:hypothetical protein
MRHLHSQFHFRHALFALQGADGYVDALMETAREGAARANASRLRRPRARPLVAGDSRLSFRR